MSSQYKVKKVSRLLVSNVYIENEENIIEKYYSEYWTLVRICERFFFIIGDSTDKTISFITLTLK